jgi:hypothetical protein
VTGAGSIVVGGLSVPLEATDSGPAVSARDPRLAPLAWVVNSALAGRLPLAEAIERGESTRWRGQYASRREPGEHRVRLERAWRGLTGTDPGEDVYVLGTSFLSDELLVPRGVLAELLRRLEALRANGGALPDEAPSLGVPSDRPGDLFAVPAEAAEPGPGSEQDLQDLNARAGGLDLLDADGARAAEAAAARRAVLFELDAAGILSAERSEAKRAWLLRAQLGSLLAYHLAAVELLAYLRGAERAEHVGERSDHVLGAPVSLDWFRLASPTEPGHTAFDWLARCEAEFRRSRISDAGQGEFLFKLGGPWYRFRWRRDDGDTAALLRVERFRPGSGRG